MGMGIQNFGDQTTTSELEFFSSLITSQVNRENSDKQNAQKVTGS